MPTYDNPAEQLDAASAALDLADTSDPAAAAYAINLAVSILPRYDAAANSGTATETGGDTGGTGGDAGGSGNPDDGSDVDDTGNDVNDANIAQANAVNWNSCTQFSQLHIYMQHMLVVHFMQSIKPGLVD